MKTHILLLSLTALLMVACASKEGRSVSSTQENPEEVQEHSKVEGYSGRDFSRQ